MNYFEPICLTILWGGFVFIFGREFYEATNQDRAAYLLFATLGSIFIWAIAHFGISFPV